MEQKLNLSFVRRNRSRPTGHQIEEHSDPLKPTYKTRPWAISIDAESYTPFPDALETLEFAVISEFIARNRRCANKRVKQNAPFYITKPKPP